jgi:hypothetical protein
LVTVHLRKTQIQEYEVGAWRVDVRPFMLQEGKRFFTIGDNMHFVRDPRISKGREREVGIRRVVFHQQYLDWPLSHDIPAPRTLFGAWAHFRYDRIWTSSIRSRRGDFVSQENIDWTSNRHHAFLRELRGSPARVGRTAYAMAFSDLAPFREL